MTDDAGVWDAVTTMATVAMATTVTTRSMRGSIARGRGTRPMMMTTTTTTMSRQKTRRLAFDSHRRHPRTTTTTTRAASSSSSSSTSSSGGRGKTVVIGASGGVGQIIVAALASRGVDVVAVSRGERRDDDDDDATMSAAPVRRITGVDCRDVDAVERSGAFDGDVEHVVCCLGTTAFPSARWRDGEGKFTNGPEATDYVSVRNVVDVVKKKCPNVKRFVMVSSVGVLRTDVMPFIILNAFGVLKHKRRGEEYLEKSTLPYTILRPGRLTDGPYTSYDLNTLLRATSGTKRAVQIGGGDDVLLPEATSRLVVAEAACAALEIDSTRDRAFELGSTEGEGPGSDVDAWRALFDAA